MEKIKNRKAADFNEIPPEVWKTSKVDNILLQLCNAIYKQNLKENDEQKAVSFPFPRMETSDSIRITKA